MFTAGMKTLTTSLETGGERVANGSTDKVRMLLGRPTDIPSEMSFLFDFNIDLLDDTEWCHTCYGRKYRTEFEGFVGSKFRALRDLHLHHMRPQT